MYIVGAMAGYHAALAIHPGTSYGVAVLLGGHYPDAAKIAYNIFELFQPAMDQSLAELAKSMYAGKWVSLDGQSSATVLVHKGTVYIENININGTDVLPMFHSPNRVALRSTHHDKFRCVRLLLLFFQFSSQKKNWFCTGWISEFRSIMVKCTWGATLIGLEWTSGVCVTAML